MTKIGVLSIENDTIYIISQHDNDLYSINLYTADCWRKIISLRYDFLYCWDITQLFAYMDAWAEKEKLINYNDIGLNKNGYKAKCDTEAISYKDGPGTQYQRKLWLKTIKLNSTDRHKRLASTTFINFENFFNGKKFLELYEAFEIDKNKNKIFALNELLNKFNEFIYQITGLYFIKSTGAPLSWTMGGISKAFYLKLYKPNVKDPKRAYLEANPQSKSIEYTLRNANLLLPGLLYMKDKRLHKNAFKYDKNSLFPAAEQELPFFSIPRKINFKDVSTYENNPKYEIIYIFKNLNMSLKNGYIPIFKEPLTHYKGNNNNNIFLEEQAFFAFYFKTISKFYNIEYEDCEVYILLKTPDRAIKKYVDILYNYKVAAKNGQISNGKYTVVKYLLNNLHGKFAQLTLNEEFSYSRNRDGIIVKEVKEIKDNWDKSHFDYIRGAWVYTKAQDIMLNDLLTLKNKGFNLGNIYYIDTDCIVTPLSNLLFPLPISSINLGEYKLEENYYKFKLYAPKTYAGINYNNEFVLTAAGMNKKEILNYLNLKFPGHNWFRKLKEVNLPCTYWKRTKIGCELYTEYRPLVTRYKDRSKSGVLL